MKPNNQYNLADIGLGLGRTNSELQWAENIEDNSKRVKRFTVKPSYFAMRMDDSKERYDLYSKLTSGADNERTANNNFTKVFESLEQKNENRRTTPSPNLASNQRDKELLTTFPKINVLPEFMASVNENTLTIPVPKKVSDDDIKLLLARVHSTAKDDGMNLQPFTNSLDLSSHITRQPSIFKLEREDDDTKSRNSDTFSRTANSQLDHAMKYFSNLSDFLMKFFKSERINETDLNLKSYELAILKSFIARKYNKNIKVKIDKYFLFEKLQELASTESLKRPEENYKFVFKRCLKNMKERFKESREEKLKKKDFERLFYEHYFKDVVELEKIPLESFYHPKNSKTKTKNCPKTINNTYIENISKSQSFVNDFLEYLNGPLEKEYREVIDSKITGLIQRWEDEFELKSRSDAVIDDICNYIEKNKKCKLPWNIKEVQEAIYSVRKLFDSVQA